MSRNRDSGVVGLLGLVGALVVVALVFVAVQLVLFSLMTPTLFGYLLIAAPEKFGSHGNAWALLAGAVACPFVAWWLVLPRERFRLPGRSRAAGRRKASRSRPERPRRATQAAAISPRSRAKRAGWLIAVVNAVTIAAFAVHPHTRPGASMDPGPASWVAFWTVVVFLLGTNLHDLAVRRNWRRHTVGDVNRLAKSATGMLDRLRSDNRTMADLVDSIETRLDGARPEVDFERYKQMHRESFRWADVAHDHSLTAGGCLREMRGLLVGIRITLRSDFLPPPRDQITGRREPVDHSAMLAARNQLAETTRRLREEFERSAVLRERLNDNTRQLKETIGTNFGTDGEAWLADLEERIQAKRVTQAH